MATDEEGWQPARRRKRTNMCTAAKIDITGSGWKEYGVRCNTFYFSEFPDSHGAREMLRAFSYYGDVVEVVIPAKRNGRGLRFGFARFRNVHDPRTFAVKLDNIIIGVKKIFVNVPKFNKEATADGGAKASVVGSRVEKIGRLGIKKVWRVKEGYEGGRGGRQQLNVERKDRGDGYQRMA